MDSSSDESLSGDPVHSPNGTEVGRSSTNAEIRFHAPFRPTDGAEDFFGWTPQKRRRIQALAKKHVEEQKSIDTLRTVDSVAWARTIRDWLEQ